MDIFSNGPVWAFVVVLTLMLSALPWLPPLRRAAQTAAVVDLDNCNGCERCADDCPYNAIGMWPRSDSLPFEQEARVDPGLCVACGICAGACPTATPFRRATALVPGIDLPERPLRDLRDRIEAATATLTGPARVVVFGCDHAVLVERLGAQSAACVSLPCIAALPPAFIDYVLSRGLADGVLLTGCRKGECYNRFGIDWMEARVAGARDPSLRRRVPRERIARYWAAAKDRKHLETAIAKFQAALADLPDQHETTPEASAGPPPGPRAEPREAKIDA